MAASESTCEQTGILYREHHGWLHRLLQHRLGCAETAADLAHDAFLRLLLRPRRFASSGEARAYLNREEALRRLLAGTGLSYRFTDADTVTLVAAQEGDGPLQLGPIMVEDQGRFTEAQDPVEGYRAEVSKTLTRGALPLQELPNTVNVVTEDSLRDRFVRTSFDAVETVPNVVRSFDNFGIEIFNIRGFNSGSVSLNTSDGLLATNQSPLDSALIERYEVLKGPASIVSGALAPGGVVNRVTKRAEFDTFANFEGTPGSRDFRRVVADGNATLFDNPALAGRLILGYEDGDGFVDRTEMERLAFSPSLSGELLDGDARHRSRCRCLRRWRVLRARDG